MDSQEYLFKNLHYFGNHHACIKFEDDNSIHYFDKEALTDITLRGESDRIGGFFEDNPPGEFGRKLDNFELSIVARVANKPLQTTGALHPEIPALQKAYNRAMLQAERDALNRLLNPQYQYVDAEQKRDEAPQYQYNDDEQKRDEDPQRVIAEKRINTPNHSFLINCLAGFSAVAGSGLLIGAIATMMPVLIGVGAALTAVGLGTLALSFFSNKKGADDKDGPDLRLANI